MGHDWNIVFMPYGEYWRRHRKAFHQHFNPTSFVVYRGIQAKRARDLLQRFQSSPNDFIGHIRHFAGAIMMEVVYGIKVLPHDDPYIQIAEEMLNAVSEAAKPGAFLVDTFPIRDNPFPLAWHLPDVLGSQTCSRVDAWSGFQEENSVMASHYDEDGCDAVHECKRESQCRNSESFCCGIITRRDG